MKPSPTPYSTFGGSDLGGTARRLAIWEPYDASPFRAIHDVPHLRRQGRIRRARGTRGGVKYRVFVMESTSSAALGTDPFEISFHELSELPSPPLLLGRRPIWQRRSRRL